MKVLVTGGAGYIGSVMVSMLLEKGYSVKCLDRLFFGRQTLEGVASDGNFELIKNDIRWFDSVLLNDVDAAIDLASLSNDPAGELNPSKTYDINYLGRVRVAKLCKECGVERYVLASTCSVYGFQGEVLNEESSTNPLTTYARSNVLAERDVLALSDNEFNVTVMRQATVYGLSPRMRFDLAVNGMVLGAYKNKKIPVMRDGTQWRPFVHVKDTSKAFIEVLGSPKDKVNGQIFNVGSNEQNIQILPLARLVKETLPITIEVEWYGSPDKRSYRVSFDKIRDVLEFAPDHTLKDGAREVYEAIKNGEVTDSKRTRTVEWYKHLLEAYNLVQEVAAKGTVL